MGQRVDDVHRHFQQAELEHLEQPDGARADDDGPGFYQLTLQQLDLGHHVFPVVGIGQRGFAFGDALPAFGAG